MPAWPWPGLPTKGTPRRQTPSAGNGRAKGSSSSHLRSSMRGSVRFAPASLLQKDASRRRRRSPVHLSRHPVRIIEGQELYRKAWSIASELQLPTCYDSLYLAAAEMNGCEFWTADKKLVGAAGTGRSWVKWLGEYSNRRRFRPQSRPNSRPQSKNRQSRQSRDTRLQSSTIPACGASSSAAGGVATVEQQGDLQGL